MEKEKTKVKVVKEVEEVKKEEEAFVETRGRKPNPITQEGLRTYFTVGIAQIDEYIRQNPQVSNMRFSRAKNLINRIIQHQLK